MGKYRRAKAGRIVTGVKELDRKLKKVETKLANKAARAGLLKGVRLGAKLAKKEVPSKLKSVKKSIGSSVKKSKGGESKGITQAKFGVSVGKKSKAKPAKRSSHGGVGITSDNVHWFVLGTANRETSSGKSTGRMPANDIIQKAFKSGKSKIRKAVVSKATEVLKKELAKLK